jgi:hypothetical protein
MAVVAMEDPVVVEVTLERILSPALVLNLSIQQEVTSVVAVAAAAQVKVLLLDQAALVQ